MSWRPRPIKEIAYPAIKHAGDVMPRGKQMTKEMDAIWNDTVAPKKEQATIGKTIPAAGATASNATNSNNSNITQGRLPGTPAKVLSPPKSLNAPPVASGLDGNPAPKPAEHPATPVVNRFIQALKGGATELLKDPTEAFNSLYELRQMAVNGTIPWDYYSNAYNRLKILASGANMPIPAFLAPYGMNRY